MLILGLTGSIAMGKSTTAGFFRGFGLPVFDADLAVHDLMAPGGSAVGDVLAAFPGVEAEGGGIDRRRLGAAVLGDVAALRRLEGILHPAVRGAERAFLRRCARNGDRIAVLDVPLLFETRGEGRCDATVVATAPAAVQWARAMARGGMTADRLGAILARQLPDAAKRRRADFVVRTGAGRAQTLADVRAVVRALAGRRPTVWPQRWLQRGRRETSQ